MIKAIIFDGGGVLTYNTDNQMYNDIAKSFDINVKEVISNFDPLVEKFERGEVSHEEMWKMFSEKINKELPLDYLELMSRSHDKNSKINNEMIDFIKELKKKGLRVGILSNTNVLHADFNRERGLFDMFDPVILSYEVHLFKPDEGIYKLLIEKLNLKADECVFVDDKKENVDAANKVGINGIQFKNVEDLRIKLEVLKVSL